jgi:molybdopterin-biosynthesis enzyme MoeA-like protein
MRLRMANTPEGATLIDNPVSRAPGFQMGNVFVMAGVPKIMQAMFDGIKHRLKGGSPMLSRTVRVELPEGKLAEGLAALQNRYSDLEMGSYPAFRMGAGPSTAIVIRGTVAERLAAAVDELKVLMRSLGGEPMDEAA